MKRLKLDKIEEEDDAFFVALRTPLDDYRLSFILNTIFSIRFKREENIFVTSIIGERKDKSSGFSYYSWTDEDSGEYWKLIANKVDFQERNTSPIAMFENIQLRFYLTKEKFDFFLKISPPLYLPREIQDVVSKISKLDETEAQQYTPRDTMLKEILSS